MTKFCLQTLLFFTALMTYSQDCNNFRIGVFKYENPVFSDWTVTRKDSIQIEYDKGSNLKMVGAINWVSDCKYNLTYIEVSDPKQKNLIGVKLTVDINAISRDEYTYQAYDNKNSINGKMIKVYPF